MKKLLVAALAVLLLAGCSSGAGVSSTVASSSPLPSSESEKADSSSETISSKESSKSPVSAAKVEAVSREPGKDDALSNKLNAYMLESFGGGISPDLCASWYKIVKDYEVYYNDDGFYAVLNLKEVPVDQDLRTVITIMNGLSDDDADIMIPPLLDASAALNIDGTNLCVAADSFCKIVQNESNAGVYYASLSAYEIPVYRYLAEIADTSETNIINNIDSLGGARPATLILNAMSAEYGGSFKGVTSHEVEIAARAAVSNFKDEYLYKVVVRKPDGNEFNTYKNQVPKK